MDNEEIKSNDLEDTIKVIKEEYEKQIEELKKLHQEEIDKIKKEEHEKTVQTIKAVMSGRKNEISEEIPAPQEELSFEEQLIRDTRENLKL